MEKKQKSARRILVVDDDAEAAGTIAEMLVELGNVPTICSNAHEALDRLREDCFDLILTDYRMPESTGIDLITMRREAECVIPVVMMTGYSATEDRVSNQDLGIIALLRKPVSPDMLAQTLHAAFVNPSS